jgi:hypothetical protein
MPHAKNRVKIGALLAFSFAALCCAVLGIHMLADDKKEGGYCDLNCA